jgi:hypothetical protein
LEWLQTLHEGSHGNSDLVAHFFRRSFGLLCEGGVFGLIATNTIGQGDTRETGLATIIATGGSITRATRRLKWPGEAAVIVSVVHVVNGEAQLQELDGRPVRRISALLEKDPKNGEPIKPFLGGDEVTTSPTHVHSRRCKRFTFPRCGG